MFFNDHAPPHFHASYLPHEAVVRIDTGEILSGHLPPRLDSVVREWVLRYHQELMDNWDRARPGRREPLQRIPGLDADDD